MKSSGLSKNVVDTMLSKYGISVLQAELTMILDIVDDHLIKLINRTVELKISKMVPVIVKILEKGDS